MDVNTKFGYFLENLGNPFIVGSLITEKTFYINKQATELFGITTEDCDLGKVFDKSPERIQSLMEKSLNQNKPTLVYNYTAITKENKKILVDLQVGYFNSEKTEVFLEIIPQNDTRMAMALQQIQHSSRAESILNFDDDLTILDCNQAFYEVFESNEDLCQAVYKKQLLQAFRVENRSQLLEEINQSLQSNKNFTKELKIETTKGEEYWYCLELQKRELDNSGTKLMCSLVNIEKQQKLKDEFSMLSRYIEATQRISGQSIYFVDLETRILRQRGQVAVEIGLNDEIPNYPEGAFPYIHPNDVNDYKEFTRKTLMGEDSRVEVRVTQAKGGYQWYEIISLVIRDDFGEMKEIFGRTTNIQKRIETQEEVSYLNKYFDVINNITDESLYFYDIKTNKLRLGGLTEKELGLPIEVDNYPESIFEYIHPDDLEMFKTFDARAIDSGNNRLEVRLKNVDRQYQWYELLSDIIFDDDGNQTEIFGRIKNIQSKHQLETKIEEANQELSIMNQYFTAMQTLSGESLYTIHTATKVMCIEGDVAHELGMKPVHTDYPNCVIDRIHPDDVDSYKDFSFKTWSGLDNEVKLRGRNTDGSYQWYRLTSRIIRDCTGKAIEILGIIRNINAAETMKAEISTMQKYFDVMQEFTDDILYRVDVPTQTLYHAYKSERTLRLGLVVPNYTETLINEKIVHPDDSETYIQQTQMWMVNDDVPCVVRMNLIKDEYEWFDIKRRKVFDDTGELVEIVGALVNIQKEREMQEEVNTINKYFDVLQEFTDDILYRVDVPTKTLHHAYQRNDLIKLASEIPNYLETLLETKIIHPDDAETFLANTKRWYSDETVVCDVRLSLFDDKYLWYSVKRRKVIDESGELVEIMGALVNIQKEREMQEDYSELDQFFTAMQELDNDVVFRIDLSTMTLTFKKQISPNKWKKIEIPDFYNTFKEGNQVHPDDRERYFRLAGAYFDGSVRDSEFHCEVRFALVTEEYVWYNVKCKKIYNKDGIPTEIYGKLLNIDTEKEITKGYSSLNQYFSAMQDLSGDVLFHIDIETMTFHHSDRDVNRYCMSYDIPDFVNTFIDKNIIHPDCHESYRRDIDDLLSGRKMDYTVLSLSKPDIYEWYYVQARFIQDEQGKPVEIFGKMKNVQARRNLEERAYHDLMTGALNKATFEEQGKIIVETATLEQKYAIIFIDLDDFKGVNDTLGHSYGDALLSTVGKRLKRLVRGDDLVGRIGGDEFAVMLRNVDSEDSVLVRTNIMLEALQKDFSFEKKVVGIKASVGVALYPQHGLTYKDLIGKADLAVYESKRRGKNVVSMYSEELEEY